VCADAAHNGTMAGHLREYLWSPELHDEFERANKFRRE
jgi:hypothetical protein